MIKHQIIICIIFCNAFCQTKRVSIFFPATISPQIIQNKFSQACPEIETTVFGQYKEFTAEINSSRPDALVTLPLIIENLPGYKIILDGEKNEKSYENYVFLSIKKSIEYQKLVEKVMQSFQSEKKSNYQVAKKKIRHELQSAVQMVSTENLSKRVIGTVDFLERNKTETFLTNSLPTSPAKIKHVSKIEELLSLLTLDLADAVIVSERHVSYFIEKSNLNFVITRVPDVRMGILALALKKGEHTSLAFSCIRELNEGLCALLGIDAWKERK